MGHKSGQRERLRELELFKLEKGKFWGHLTARGLIRETEKDFLNKANCNNTMGSGFELKYSKFSLALRKKIFTMRVMRHWNLLPREVVDASYLEAFKVRLI